MRSTAAIAWASVKSSGSRVLVAAEGSVFVSEADAAVELGVSGEAFLDAGHADEDHRQVGSVVFVTEEFEGCRVEAFGFIDDEQLHERGDSVH